MSEEYKTHRNYFIINTERDGLPSSRGEVQSSPEQMEQVVQNVIAFFKSLPPEQPPRLIFCFHGGLVDEARALEVMHFQYRTFLDNGIYPVYFIWESGFEDTIEDVREHFWPSVVKNAPLGMLQPRFWHEVGESGDFFDEILEEIVKHHYGWDAIKLRARDIFDGGFGWTFLQRLFAVLQEEGSTPEWHVMGHSAGAVVLGTLLEMLEATPPPFPIRTCSMYAPACTVEYFEDFFGRALDLPKSEASSSQPLLHQFFLYTLSQEGELEDSVIDIRFYRRSWFKIYRKSLLYLVSQGWEARDGHPAPLLGMERYARKSDLLQKIIDQGRGTYAVSSGPNRFVTENGIELDLPFVQEHHGGFGTNSKVLNATLKTILKKNQPRYPF
jgi:hypothetical protein